MLLKTGCITFIVGVVLFLAGIAGAVYSGRLEDARKAAYASIAVVIGKLMGWIGAVLCAASYVIPLISDASHI